MNQFKQLKSFGILIGVILIVLGLILLIWPDNIIKFLAIIVGSAILLTGLGKGFSAFKNRNGENGIQVPKIALSILLAVLGLYVLINTNVTVTAIGVCIGIFAIISAFDRFSISIERRKLGHKIMATVCFGVVNLAFGIGMIFASLKIMSMVLMLVGIYLIVEGIMIIISSKILFDL